MRARSSRVRRPGVAGRTLRLRSGPEPGNPQALNRYSYVLNNPMSYTDPTGHFCVGPGWACDAGKAVGGKVGSMAKDLVTDKIPDAAEAAARYGPLVTCTAPGPACAVAIACAAGDCVGKGVDAIVTVIEHSEVVPQTAGHIAHLGAHSVTDAVAYGFYAEFWVSYQALEILNRMPGQSEWIIKGMFPGLYVQLLLMEAHGLAGNTLADAFEAKVLGVDEAVFDDADEKNIVFGPLRWAFRLLHIPMPVRYLPGIRYEDGKWVWDVNW